ARLVRGALPRTSTNTEIARADRTRECDPSRRTEAGSHVRDGEGEKVVADAERGELLVFPGRLATSRNVQPSREHGEVGSQAQIGADLRVGEAADAARRSRAC